MLGKRQELYGADASRGPKFLLVADTGKSGIELRQNLDRCFWVSITLLYISAYMHKETEFLHASHSLRVNECASRCALPAHRFNPLPRPAHTCAEPQRHPAMREIHALMARGTHAAHMSASGNRGTSVGGCGHKMNEP